MTCLDMISMIMPPQDPMLCLYQYLNTILFLNLYLNIALFINHSHQTFQTMLSIMFIQIILLDKDNNPIIILT